MKSKIGHISLIIAVGGLVITELGIYLGLLSGQGWTILATGFEAATIGALADWFAVSALFHKIPIPLVSRHTNIIVKNRHKLTEAIVELVTTKWLSSDVIHEKLQGVRIAEGIFKMLEKPNNLNRVMDFLRNLLHRFSENLDNPQMATLFQKLLKDQLKDLEITTPLGSWIENMVHGKDHVRIINLLLEELENALDDPATRNLLLGKLKWAMDSYENQDWIKKLAFWIGKKTGGIDLELITDRLLDIFKMVVKEARQDPSHPLRQKIDQSLLKFGLQLKGNDPDIIKFVNHLKNRLMDDGKAHVMILEVLSRLKITFTEELAYNDTNFMKLFEKNVTRLIKEMQTDKSSQDSLDEWLKGTFARLINNYHHEVGNMVRSSLFKLDDKGLVLQIKEKVGDDLQYIRLNGAVVGGFAGIIIAVLRILLLQ